MLVMNKPEWPLIGIGCIACLINGGIQPVFGIILSKLTAVKFCVLFKSLFIKIFI
jgi:presenilin-like A22 family membrane protease